MAGLGLLDVETVLTADKSTTLVRGTHVRPAPPIGLRDSSRPQRRAATARGRWLSIDGRADGASSADGRVAGTYVHGLFAGDAFRQALLAQFGIASSLAYEARIESALDALADHLEAHLDIDRILEIARSRQTTSASAA